MLLVKTYLFASSIHGIGVFSKEFIPKGTITWRFDTVCDKKIPLALIPSFPIAFQEFLSHYAYVERGCRVLLSDNDRFMNHSGQLLNSFSVE